MWREILFLFLLKAQPFKGKKKFIFPQIEYITWKEASFGKNHGYLHLEIIQNPLSLEKTV